MFRDLNRSSKNLIKILRQKKNLHVLFSTTSFWLKKLELFIYLSKNRKRDTKAACRGKKYENLQLSTIPPFLKAFWSQCNLLETVSQKTLLFPDYSLWLSLNSYLTTTRRTLLFKYWTFHSNVKQHSGNWFTVSDTGSFTGEK